MNDYALNHFLPEFLHIIKFSTCAAVTSPQDDQGSNTKDSYFRNILTFRKHLNRFIIIGNNFERSLQPKCIPKELSKSLKIWGYFLIYLQRKWSKLDR